MKKTLNKNWIIFFLGLGLLTQSCRPKKYGCNPNQCEMKIETELLNFYAKIF